MEAGIDPRDLGGKLLESRLNLGKGGILDSRNPLWDLEPSVENENEDDRGALKLRYFGPCRPLYLEVDGWKIENEDSKRSCDMILWRRPITLRHRFSSLEGNVLFAMNIRCFSDTWVKLGAPCQKLPIQIYFCWLLSPKLFSDCFSLQLKYLLHNNYPLFKCSRHDSSYEDLPKRDPSKAKWQGKNHGSSAKAK